MRCWRYAAPSIMARSIGYSSGIDGAYEKRKNHRMLLAPTTGGAAQRARREAKAYAPCSYRVESSALVQGFGILQSS
jgi:hypothetical protein